MRRLAVLTACAFGLFVAGCGQDPGNAVVEADTEGVWVDVGPLDYHVQGSRQLNPSEVPDDRYLSGLPAGYKQPTGQETWFGVFLRIENTTNKPAPTAQDFQITDTEGNTFKPVPLNTKVNPFAYLPQDLGIKEALPHPDSTQETDSAAGALVLFKLPLTSYQNRPLEFHITAPAGTAQPGDAEVDLDV